MKQSKSMYSVEAWSGMEAGEEDGMLHGMMQSFKNLQSNDPPVMYPPTLF